MQGTALYSYVNIPHMLNERYIYLHVYTFWRLMNVAWHNGQYSSTVDHMICGYHIFTDDHY